MKSLLLLIILILLIRLSFITQPVKTQINAFGNVLFENVNVLTETLDKDGLIPVKFNKLGIGLDGVSFISATYAENSNPPTDTNGGSSQTDENQKDTTTPTINDFWIVNNDLKLEDNITIRFMLQMKAVWGAQH